MPNGIKNATGLDGVTDWSIDGGVTAAISIDESELGGPGRAVIVGTRTATVGQYAALITSRLQFAEGELIEVFAHHAADHAGAPIASRLYASWFNGLGVGISNTAIAAGQIAPRPRRGLPSTFAFNRVRLTPPADARAVEVYVIATAPSSGLLRVALLKPFIGGVASGDRPPCWSPGPHTNPDLDLDIWPESLPDFRELDSPRTPTRTAFSTDAQIPVGRRFGTRGRIRFTGELKLTLEQRDTLDQFVEARNLLPDSAPFWFVHPDTRQLTRAWIDPEDGEPSDSGRGRDRRTRVGLMLEVA